MGLIYSDIPELEGSNTEISLTNLSELEAELEELIEKRLAHLAELSDAILSDGGDPDLIKSIFLSIRSDGNADSGNVIEENRPFADAMFSRLSLVERLVIFKETFGKISAEKRNLFKYYWQTENVDVAQEAADRIAYLKNSYNDMAYLQLSSLLASPRAAYFGSVTDVCESVYNGECEYCILPVETAEDGKLRSFYELILKYNFNICAVYDLHSNSGYTRYALLSKKFVLQNDGIRRWARKRYLEFVIMNGDSVSLIDLLSAAELCGLKLRRIDTLNLRIDKNTNGSYTCPVFRVDEGDIQTFLAFLAIDISGIIPIGLYIQI